MPYPYSHLQPLSMRPLLEWRRIALAFGGVWSTSAHTHCDVENIQNTLNKLAEHVETHTSTQNV